MWENDQRPFSRPSSGKPPRAEQPLSPTPLGTPGTWVATALPPTATLREQRPQAAARAEETRRPEACDDARPYLPNSRRAGIMDASSSPWSPMVTASGSQNSRRQCPGFSTAASGGEGGASTGTREVQNFSRKPLLVAVATRGKSQRRQGRGR